MDAGTVSFKKRPASIDRSDGKGRSPFQIGTDP
jgi:hypothetical protein